MDAQYTGNQISSLRKQLGLTQRELAEKLGVGRGSLRECLAILEFLGAIDTSGYRKMVLRGADYIRKVMSFIQVSVQADTQDEFNEFRKVNEMAIAAFACELRK